MPHFTFVTAWRRADPDQVAEAARFWLTHGLKEPEEVEDSGFAMCSLAYLDGRLVGVSTVDFRQHPPLRSRLVFCHCAVAPEVRRRGLAGLLIRHTLTVMEGWSLEHPQERLNGLAAVIKAPQLREKALDPVWSEHQSNFNLAGFTPNGGQIRVAWFRHARLDPPPA